jgi:hypothetical protein
LVYYLNIAMIFYIIYLFVDKTKHVIFLTLFFSFFPLIIFLLLKVPLGKIPLGSMWKAAGTLIIEQGADKLGVFDWFEQQFQQFF